MSGSRVDESAHVNSNHRAITPQTIQFDYKTTRHDTTRFTTSRIRPLIRVAVVVTKVIKRAAVEH